jgi:hypothetical protein
MRSPFNPLEEPMSLLPPTIAPNGFLLSISASQPPSRWAWNNSSLWRFKGPYKNTAADTTYPAHDAWQASQERGDVQFTSQLCGTALSAHSNWHLDIRDVAKRVCRLTIETGPYPSKSGSSTPTLLALAETAQPQETLDDFVQLFLKGRYALARPTAAPTCPSV